jgi:hypothetical protein
MKAAAKNQARVVILNLMRYEARHLDSALGHGITIEDVYPVVCRVLSKSLREVVDILGPAAGSVFKCSEWEFTGRRIQATVNRRSHARELKVWRLAT